MQKTVSKSVLILAGLGASQLVLGLILSLFVALNHSWILGLILAAGFFASANILFYTAWKKLH